MTTLLLLLAAIKKLPEQVKNLPRQFEQWWWGQFVPTHLCKPAILSSRTAGRRVSGPADHKFAQGRERLSQLLRAHAAFGKVLKESGTQRKRVTPWPEPLGTSEHPDPDPVLVEVRARQKKEQPEPLAEELDVRRIERQLEEAQARLKHRRAFLAGVAQARDKVAVRA